MLDIETGEQIHHFTGHFDDINDSKFSPDGTYILSASSDNTLKQSSVPSSSYANSLIGKDGTSTNSFQSFNSISKTEQFSQTNVTEPSLPGVPVSRPFLNNQYNSRQHQQPAGHQRGIFLCGATALWCFFLCF